MHDATVDIDGQPHTMDEGEGNLQGPLQRHLMRQMKNSMRLDIAFIIVWLFKDDSRWTMTKYRRNVSLMIRSGRLNVAIRHTKPGSYRDVLLSSLEPFSSELGRIEITDGNTDNLKHDDRPHKITRNLEARPGLSATLLAVRCRGCNQRAIATPGSFQLTYSYEIGSCQSRRLPAGMGCD